MINKNEEFVAEEYGRLDLGDKRLDRRVKSMVGLILEKPSEGFPKIFDEESSLEAAYRLLRNPRVSLEDAVSPHLAATRERCKQHPVVLAISDTTEFEFPGESRRKGLGRLRTEKSQGFLGHFSFGVSSDGLAMPLGVLGVKTMLRLGKSKKQQTQAERWRDKERESVRWWKLVEEVEEQAAGNPIVHVMDREADDYQLFSKMSERGYRFLIRACRDRKLKVPADESCDDLFESIENTSAIYERLVPICRRKESKCFSNRKTHPKRDSRLAKLVFHAKPIEIKRPRHSGPAPLQTIPLNIIWVREVDTPDGIEPVDWKLMTTEPITTSSEVLQIVDWYRNRWVIEEYFKALKTGCAYESRQLESYETLTTALALCIPIAWRLLLLRTLARQNPDLPATTLLNQIQVAVLCATSKKKMEPATLTLAGALQAIAAMGGHIKNNGSPGWLVLARGFKDLLLLETGWAAAQNALSQSTLERCDQS